MTFTFTVELRKCKVISKVFVQMMHVQYSNSETHGKDVNYVLLRI